MNWITSLWKRYSCLYFFTLRPRILLSLVSSSLFVAINTSLSFRPVDFYRRFYRLFSFIFVHETINCATSSLRDSENSISQWKTRAFLSWRCKRRIMHLPPLANRSPRVFRIIVLKPMFTYSRYFVRKSFLTQKCSGNTRKEKVPRR